MSEQLSWAASAGVFDPTRPSAEELEHDFLWRTTCRLPERGRIGVFNRWYYEDVLVVRVRPELLRSQGQSQALHDSKNSAPPRRYQLRGN